MEQQNLTNATEIILQMRREIEAERRAHEDTVQALEKKLKEFTTASQVTPTQSVAESNVLSRRKALKWPELFDGTRSKFPAWKQEIEDKLDVDKDQVGSWKAQWYGINQCLGEKPKRVVATFYAAGGPLGQYNPEEFLKYLELSYGDPNQASKAAARLRTIKQGERQSFAAFLPTFEQTLAEAGGSDWADAAKLTLLDSAINDNLRRALVSVDLPEDYSSWIQQVIRVSYRLEAISTGPSKWARYQNTGSPSKDTQQDNDGDVQMSGVMAMTTESRKSQRARWVPEEEIQKRRQERRCFRCGASAHMVSGCPYLPAIRPRTTGVASAMFAPLLEEISIGESEEGKE
jgi:hypothetical protein